MFTRIDIHCKLNGTYETCKYDAFQIFVTLIFMQAVFPILNIGVLWDESILPMREYAHVTFILNWKKASMKQNSLMSTLLYMTK